MNNLNIQDVKEIFEQYFQKGGIESWKNKDFHDLSFKIQEKTKVLVSASTLKRIFGKLKTKESYTPQEATLQALVEYALSVQQEFPVSPKAFSSKNQVRIIFSIAAVILMAVPSYFMFDIYFKDTNVDTNVTVDRIEGHNTATVFFNIEGETHKKNDFQLHFGDYIDTVTLSKTQNKTGHFYKYPGVFHPQLLKGDKVIKTFDKVVVPTDGWVAIGTGQFMNRDISIFPIAKEIIQKPKGFWHMTTSDMAKCGIDTSQLNVIRLYNYQDYDMDGDQFRLKLKVKSAGFWPQTNCNNIIVRVRCENGMIQQYFSKPGCSYWIHAHYSEIYKSGNKQDMSAFCIDLSDWGNIEIVNDNKNIDFKVNEENIYTQSYKKSLGEIIGLELFFYGTGSIDDLELSSIDGSMFYKENFGQME